MYADDGPGNDEQLGPARLALIARRLARQERETAKEEARTAAAPSDGDG